MKDLNLCCGLCVLPWDRWVHQAQVLMKYCHGHHRTHSTSCLIVGSKLDVTWAKHDETVNEQTLQAVNCIVLCEPSVPSLRCISSQQ